MFSDVQGERRRQGRGLHDDDGHRARDLPVVHESQADPSHTTSALRGARRLHERRLSGGDQGPHAMWRYPSATGVCRWAAHWCKCVINL